FRKAHTAISRFGYWRDDVRWFGAKGDVDFDSQALAYLLNGDASHGGTLYVMINGSDAAIEFVVQKNAQHGWRPLVDTSQEDAFSFPAHNSATLEPNHWLVQPRSVFVLGSIPQ